MGCGDPQTSESTWSEWRNFVLKELERHDNNIEALREKLENSRIDVKELQVRYSIITIACEVAGFVIYYLLTH